MFRAPHAVLTPVFLLTLCAASLIGQSGTKNGEWRTYGGDLGSTRYAPLDQINAQQLQAICRSPGVSRPTSSAGVPTSTSRRRR